MSNNTKRTWYLLFIFILLLTNIVAGYFWYNSTKDNKVLTEEKNELQEEYMSVQQDLNIQLAELDKMKGQNAQLDSIISLREKEISDQQAEISKLFKQKKFTSAELSKAKTLIKNLESENMIFRQKVDSLSNYAGVLLVEKDSLTTDLTIQKAENAKIDSINDFLDDKVELGSILRADELSISGVFVKKNGVERTVNRIAKIEKIKVCYQTGDNLVRDKGNVDMYLRILTPSGTTLYNEVNGSGTFEDNEGKDVRYSKKASFDYEGKNKNVCIYWTQELSEKGNYKAQVFQDGFLVGESTIELK